MSSKQLSDEQIADLSSTVERGTCELCGTENKSLAPYGPKGEKICTKCGFKNADSVAKFLSARTGEKITADSVRQTMIDCAINSALENLLGEDVQVQSVNISSFPEGGQKSNGYVN